MFFDFELINNEVDRAQEVNVITVEIALISIIVIILKITPLPRFTTPQ